MDPLERHWRFNALSTSARDAALSSAARRTPLAVTDDEVLLPITELADCYDYAVVERFDIDVAQQWWPTTAPDTARELALSADRALTLLAALPLPSEPAALLVRRLHVAALAAIARRQEEFAHWRRRLEADRSDPSGDMADVWDALLTEQHLGDAERVRSSIAFLREQVSTARPGELQQALGNARATALLNAASDLLTYRVSGSPTDILSRYKGHVLQARAAHMLEGRAPLASDRTMHAMLAWLAYAIAAVVEPRDDQLSLPTV